MEYPNSCSTAMRRVTKKMAAIEGRLIWFGGDFTMGCSFWMSGLAYGSMETYQKCMGLQTYKPIFILAYILYYLYIAWFDCNFKKWDRVQERVLREWSMLS